MSRRIVLLVVLCALMGVLGGTVPRAWGAYPSEPAAAPTDHRPNDSSPIGTNIGKLASGESLWLVDQMKRAEGWLTQCDDSCGYQWNTNEQDRLVLDEHGWVISFGDSDRDFTHIAFTLFAGSSQSVPAGEWIVLYDGEGTLSYGHAPYATLLSSAPGRDVITITPQEGSLLLVRISNINPQNHLRNIRIIPPGGICDGDPLAYAEEAADCGAGTFASFEQIYPSQRFHPLLLQDLSIYRALRFMQFQAVIDDTTSSPWAERSQLDDAIWGNSYNYSPPQEVIFELSNAVMADPWVNMPHWADDAYVAAFAQLALEQLDPSLKIYVEYVNEVWNTAYPYDIYGQQIQGWAEQRWPGGEQSGYTKRMNWVGMRSAQMCAVWKNVWGAQSDRVQCVMPGAPWSWAAAEALACPLYAAEGTVENCAGQMDAMAIAPYFGGYFNDNPEADGGYRDQLYGWTQLPDGGLTNVFHELRTGALLDHQYSQDGALPAISYVITDNMSVAQQYDLQLVAYEGGQHMTPVSPLGTSCSEWNHVPGCDTYYPIQNLFITANRDARMGLMYTDYLNRWRELGGTLFMHYLSHQLPHGQYGAWGAQEYAGQPAEEAPKYRAMRDFISDNPCWWEGCELEHVEQPASHRVFLPLKMR